MIIAIDGPASSGKGTMSRLVANALSIPHVDTGLLYRSLAYAFLQQDKKEGESTTSRDKEQRALRLAQQLKLPLTGSEALRTESVGVEASRLAKLPAIRSALVLMQREYGHFCTQNYGGAVFDGRDIGTVIFPDADYKFFLDSSASVRARRRYKELIQNGESVIYNHVLFDLQARDNQDMRRAVSPLIPAKDAVRINSSALTIDEVLLKILSRINPDKT